MLHELAADLQPTFQVLTRAFMPEWEDRRRELNGSPGQA
jgi:hypothetical protein